VRRSRRVHNPFTSGREDALIDLRHSKGDIVMRGRFGLFGVLFIVVFALLIGGVAYSWGLAAGQTQVVAPGTVAYPVVYGHPFGFGFGLFGLFFFLLIFALLISAFRGRRWAGGPGGWGRGMGPGGPGWGGRYGAGDPGQRQWQDHDVPPAFEEWHRRAHGDSTPTGSSGGSGSSGGPPTAS
jgi:hypothetical protein